MIAKELLRFENHLESCDACRTQLDRVSTESEFCGDLRDLLPDDAFDTRALNDLATEFDNRIDHDRHSKTSTSTSVRQLLRQLNPTDDPEMLGRIGPYEVVGVVGAGSMGVVLKCVDTSLNRVIAVKVLAAHLAYSGAARQRFTREAQSAAAVVHENVIAIHGVVEDEELPYLAMPYERGVSLQTRIDDTGALEIVEIVRIGLQIARGLSAAHSQGLIHRDVKPANILLPDGVERVKITDFGLARAADDASLTQS